MSPHTDPGTQQLREQLERLDESLRAFEDPIVSEVAGLRLMQETLRERRGHIAQQIQRNETCTLELVLSGVSAAPPHATVIAALLEAVQAAVSAAAADRADSWPAPDDARVAEAVGLRLAAFGDGGDSDDDADVTLTLTRPPGPLATQVADPETGAPLVEHAVADVVAALGADGPGGSVSLRTALRRLGEVIVSAGVALRCSLRPALLPGAAAQVDAAAAQRLASMPES